MTEIIHECTICSHVQIDVVKDKTTAVCEACRWPVDIYADGRIVTSPLVMCRGDVKTPDIYSCCTGFGGGWQSVASIDNPPWVLHHELSINRCR